MLMRYSYSCEYESVYEYKYSELFSLEKIRHYIWFEEFFRKEVFSVISFFFFSNYFRVRAAHLFASTIFQDQNSLLMLRREVLGAVCTFNNYCLTTRMTISSQTFDADNAVEVTHDVTAILDTSEVTTRSFVFSTRSPLCCRAAIP